MQRTKFVFLAVWACVLAVAVTLTGQPTAMLAQGAVIYVSPSGTDEPTCGASLAQACRTIKYAVETVAQAGDQIQVADGVYTDTVTINTQVHIYGTSPYNTIMDGEGIRGPLVTVSSGLTSTTVISGLTIQNGLGALAGGGLSIDDSSPTIRAVVVQSNTAQSGSNAGIYLAGGANPAIHGSVMCGNGGVQLQNAGTEPVDATGNWWGTNSPQSGSAYTGTVTASPAITVGLTVQPGGTVVFPGGTMMLPSNRSGQLLVSMTGGGYNAPDGTPLTILANNALFENGTNSLILSLVDGMATTVFTPTGITAVNLSAYHYCNPTEALVSATIDIYDTSKHLFFPVIMRQKQVCPTTSTNQYALIPTIPPQIDHPDRLHGDLNLSQRGYNAASNEPLHLIDYAGPTDSLAPQLPGLFVDNRTPSFSSAYKVNGWNWACSTHGCPGPPLNEWGTSLLGLATTAGEAIRTPTRSPNIFNDGSNNYKALVLYAEEERITVNFTRDDSVAHGYSIQIENICVDPNLLALYRAQVGSDGFRSSNVLPGLTANQAIGTAKDVEILVAVRDRGNFMDPRSRKDWWMGRLAKSIQRLDIEHPTGVVIEK